MFITRAWWIEKTTDLLLTLSSSKRLTALRNIKLCNTLPITSLLRILIKDKIILTKPCIQRRVLKALNAMIQIDQFDDLAPEQQDTLKAQLAENIREVEFDMVEPLETLPIDRLVSILHGLTGNLPTVELVDDHNDKDGQRQSTADNCISTDYQQVDQMVTVSRR